MKKPPHKYTREQLQQPAKIKALFEQVEQYTSEELHILMSKELLNSQPIIPETIKLLFRSHKYTIAQLEDVMRFSLLILSYYEPLIPPDKLKVDEALLMAMVTSHNMWLESVNELPLDMQLGNWRTCALHHAAGSLFRFIFDNCIHQPYNQLKNLHVDDRLIIMNNLKIILDSFEELLNNPSIQGYFFRSHLN